MQRIGSPVIKLFALLATCFFLVGSVSNLQGQCQNNVLPNPGFEQGLSNWTILGETELANDAVSGSFSADITGDGNRIFQTIPASPGNEYSLTLAWKKLGALGDATAGFKFLDASYIPISFHLVDLLIETEFEFISPIIAIAPPGTSYIEVTAYTNAQSPNLRVDDFCLTINGGMNNDTDLSVADMQGTFLVEQGGDLIFTFDLVNSGNQLINIPIKVAAYLSTDNNLSADDTKVGEITQPTTPIGILEDLDLLVSIPFNYPVGTHRLFLAADADDVVEEMNEGNNVINISFEVEVAVVNPPDCDLNVTIGQAGEFVCSDNGTPNDPTDDTWGLPFLAENEGNTSGSGWEITGGGVSITGNWGEEKIIAGFLIADGLMDLTVTDLEDANCTLTLNNIPPPNACSNGSFSGCSNNLLPNSGFENDLDLWTSIGQANITNDAVEGEQALSIAGDGNRIIQTINAQAGDRFSLSAQVRKLGTNGAAAIGIKYLDGAYLPLADLGAAIPVSATYLEVTTAILEAPTNTAFIEISAYTDPGASAILVDDFCLRNNSIVQPPGKFDFEIIDIESPAEAVTGSSFSFTYKISNSGDADYPGNVTIGTYVSLDANLSADDFLLEEFAVTEVNLGLSETKTRELVLSDQLQSGSFYFIINADDAHLIDETSELNNWTSVPLTIEQTLDLIPVDCQSVSPLPKVEYLAAVKINEEEVRSAKSEYSNFRNVNFDIALSEENSVSLTVGYDNINYPEYFRIFVDFNHDGWYSPSEVFYQGVLEPLGFADAPFLTLESGPIALPNGDYKLGLTKMRVVMSRNGYPPPCGLILNGAVEDYSVNIVNFLEGHPFSDRGNLEPTALKVYPNPANQFININLEDAFGSDGIVYLTNSLGQIVWSRQLQNIEVNVYSIDTALMGSGIYGIWLKSDGASAKFAKVMVKR